MCVPVVLKTTHKNEQFTPLKSTFVVVFFSLFLFFQLIVNGLGYRKLSRIAVPAKQFFVLWVLPLLSGDESATPSIKC